MCVVAVAVVEDHVGLVRVLREPPHLAGPFLQFLVAVAVAEALLYVLALPLVRVTVQADDR